MNNKMHPYSVLIIITLNYKWWIWLKCNAKQFNTITCIPHVHWKRKRSFFFQKAVCQTKKLNHCIVAIIIPAVLTMKKIYNYFHSLTKDIIECVLTVRLPPSNVCMCAIIILVFTAPSTHELVYYITCSPRLIFHSSFLIRKGYTYLTKWNSW